MNCVKNFIEELNIKKALDNYHVDFKHYQEMNGITHTSTVDHIFWNEASEDKIVDAGVVHLPENTSDHCPVYCVIDVGKVQDHAGRKQPLLKKMTLNPILKMILEPFTYLTVFIVVRMFIV